MISRRNALQWMLMSSVSTVVPTLAHASENDDMGSALPTCDISIYQHDIFGRERITLMNHSNRAISLDSLQPVDLVNVNGRLKVCLKEVRSGGVVLQPGERLSFVIEAESLGSVNRSSKFSNVVAGHVRIRSDHRAFNGVVPVRVFDNQPVLRKRA